MKRYLLFAIDQYYPGGGREDFVNDFDSAEDAKTVGDAMVERGACTWVQVVDTETRKEIQENAVR